jgi:hypothetical protein
MVKYKSMNEEGRYKHFEAWNRSYPSIGGWLINPDDGHKRKF